MSYNLNNREEYFFTFYLLKSCSWKQKQSVLNVNVIYLYINFTIFFNNSTFFNIIKDYLKKETSFLVKMNHISFSFSTLFLSSVLDNLYLKISDYIGDQYKRNIRNTSLPHHYRTSFFRFKLHIKAISDKQW